MATHHTDEHDPLFRASPDVITGPRGPFPATFV